MAAYCACFAQTGMYIACRSRGYSLTVGCRAGTYLEEGDDEMTYFLLFRHAHLVLSNITAHPEARHPAFRAAIEKNKTEVNKNFKVLEALKGKLNERYERYQSIIKDREARQASGNRGVCHLVDL